MQDETEEVIKKSRALLADLQKFFNRTGGMTQAEMKSRIRVYSAFLDATEKAKRAKVLEF